MDIAYSKECIAVIPKRSDLHSSGPRIIAWEVTRRCPLACTHCRGGAADRAYEGELTTEECFKIMDSLAELSQPMIIWTGGEPMARSDISILVRGATERGMRSVLAPCGMLVDHRTLTVLQRAGVDACSFSLDGATPQTHDGFRGVAGAYDHILNAMRVAKDIGMPFQINCTVSKRNLSEIPQVYQKAVEAGARMLDLFFLVPVGRGREIADLAVEPEQAEEVLRWAFEINRAGPEVKIRQTCAPQSVRVWESMGRPGMHPAGCMGGKSFVFLSHVGILQPCGFLDIPCGDVRAANYDFGKVWRESEVFRALRDPNGYGGACGKCRFRFECGGCRARAYAREGDFLAQDVSCPVAASATTENH